MAYHRLAYAMVEVQEAVLSDSNLYSTLLHRYFVGSAWEEMQPLEAEAVVVVPLICPHC